MIDYFGEGNEALEHFDKYCSVYTRLIEFAVLTSLEQIENYPGAELVLDLVLDLEERLEIIKRIAIDKFTTCASFGMSEDQIYEDLKVEFLLECSDEVGVNCLRGDEKH